MKIKQVYIWRDGDTLKSKATIDVAGLGDIQFECALSSSTIAIICAEAEAALRVRLGQDLSSLP